MASWCFKLPTGLPDFRKESNAPPTALSPSLAPLGHKSSATLPPTAAWTRK